MTQTEWTRKRRRLLTGEPVEWEDADGRHEIRVFSARYGIEYSLVANGNVVDTTWNIDRIGALLID